MPQSREATFDPRPNANISFAEYDGLDVAEPWRVPLDSNRPVPPVRHVVINRISGYVFMDHKKTIQCARKIAMLPEAEAGAEVAGEGEVGDEAEEGWLLIRRGRLQRLVRMTVI